MKTLNAGLGAGLGATAILRCYFFSNIPRALRAFKSLLTVWIAKECVGHVEQSRLRVSKREPELLSSPVLSSAGRYVKANSGLSLNKRPAVTATS